MATLAHVHDSPLSPVVLTSQKRSLSPLNFEQIDIERVSIPDDPRTWSKARKLVILVVLFFTSAVATIAANVQNPGIQQIEHQLHASSSEITLSLSLFILVQGLAPFPWSGLSHIIGRKLVFLLSSALFTASSAVIATTRSMGLVIGMRCVQGAGGSAIMAIGATTLEDIFEPTERRVMTRIYHMAPSLGLALEPILGGALTHVFGWRTVYWLLVAAAGTFLVAFLLFFKETYSCQRGLAYRLSLKRDSEENKSTRVHSISLPTSVSTHISEIGKSRRSSVIDVIVAGHPFPQEVAKASLEQEKADRDDPIKDGSEAQKNDVHLAVEARIEDASGKSSTRTDERRCSLKDVNPFQHLLIVLRRWNNIAVLIPSALLFGFATSISYTSARTLGREYNYNALQIGAVLFSYGAGAVIGNVVGGYWSDRTFVRLKAKHGCNHSPEMRLHGTKLAMLVLPAATVGYAWTCEKRVNIGAICVMLFLIGLSAQTINANMLAYKADVNAGRSSAMVATNGLFRGLCAFAAAEVAVPLQDAIGEGWMYTLWAGLLVIGNLLIVATLWKGSNWRKNAEAREAGAIC